MISFSVAIVAFSLSVFLLCKSFEIVVRIRSRRP